jgi:hypothetical protein
MKKFYFLLLAFGLFTGVEAQIINISDPVFKAKLRQANTTTNLIAKGANHQYIKIDVNGNGEIEVDEALNVLSLDVSNPYI